MEIVPARADQPAAADFAPGGLRRIERRAGKLIWRAPRRRHRLEVADPTGALTLWARGPTVREWGFH